MKLNASQVTTAAPAPAPDLEHADALEQYRIAGQEILEILNETGPWRECIQRVLNTLKVRTGFHAVGIRLQEGEDYPYFVQEGFSNAFLETEMTLLESEGPGPVCRAPDGTLNLACTCGLVISGRGSPLLTPRGSFWTNDSPQLLELTPGEDPRFRPRNVCIHHGYASVALVPIRSKGRIVGLIQLNDRNPDRFACERIEVLEEVATQIGEALVRKKIEATLLERERELHDNQERLRRMAFEATAAQERERRRIALELHDSIGQSLAVSVMKLTAVRDEVSGASRASIDEVVEVLRQSLDDSRTLVFALSPPVLYDLGLGAALSWLAEDLEKKHGLRVELEAGGGQVDETTALAVFRAARELLMNVIKHAGSATATVHLRESEGHLELVVEDGGRGFEPASASHTCFGLFSLREQVRGLGGTFELISAKDRGTRATVRVPVGDLPGPVHQKGVVHRDLEPGDSLLTRRAPS
ncbi:MAG: GAF domain-containing sensor histidine kinase [Archangium sp.]|nr:GAF domain-containing sensor histidine kinase [Archangium sp.]